MYKQTDHSLVIKKNRRINLRKRKALTTSNDPYFLKLRYFLCNKNALDYTMLYNSADMKLCYKDAVPVMKDDLLRVENPSIKATGYKSILLVNYLH